MVPRVPTDVSSSEENTMRIGSGSGLIALAVAFALTPVLAVADKAPTKPASPPSTAQTRQGPLVITPEVIKVPCPRVDFEARITINGSDAARWKPQLLHVTGQSAKRLESPKGHDGRDELRCLYEMSGAGFGTNFKYFVRRSALATHPLCISDDKLFKCRPLKKGENYATAEY
jgi:hypothetical protein